MPFTINLEALEAVLQKSPPTKTILYAMPTQGYRQVFASCLITKHGARQTDTGVLRTASGTYVHMFLGTRGIMEYVKNNKVEIVVIVSSSDQALASSLDFWKRKFCHKSLKNVCLTHAVT